MRLSLDVLNGTVAVARLDPLADLPDWFDWRASPIASVTRTESETSVVCAESAVPPAVRAERDWRVIKVKGPLDFALAGILLSVLAPLSAAKISMFALSTFDTDYVLVRRDDVSRAIAVLRPHHDIAVEGGTVVYRRAAASDVQAVRALTRAAYAKWVPLAGREPKPMTADYDRAVRDHIIDMVWTGGEPAALIEMIQAADHLLVENVAVSPAFQGQGHGKSLMAHAEQVARSIGLSKIRLYTNKLFAANILLYNSLGYSIDREEPIGDRIAVHMSKSL